MVRWASCHFFTKGPARLVKNQQGRPPSASEPHSPLADSTTLRLVKARYRQDENFAVAHSASAGDLRNAVNHLGGSRVVHPSLDFYLGQEGEGVFRVAVFRQVALLAAVTFHFADGKGFDRGLAQRL